MAARTLSKNMSSISSEPLDLDLRGLEKFYDKKNTRERKYQLAKNKRVQQVYGSLNSNDNGKKSEIISGRYIDYGGPPG